VDITPRKRLSALVIQPGYWKLTTVRIKQRLHQALPTPPPFLRTVTLYNYTCLDILEDLTLLEDLTIQRHAHDQRRYPSEFVFGQWASGLKRLTLKDPHLRILPSLTRLPILESLDLTGCNKLQSVDTQDVCESLSTLILDRCSAMPSVPPLTRFKPQTRVVFPSI
jgi:hypothetical protein